VKLHHKALLCLLIAPALAASEIRHEIWLVIQPNAVLYISGQAQTFDDDGQPTDTRIAGSVSLYSGAFQLATDYLEDYWPWVVYSGFWADSWHKDGAPGMCYRAALRTWLENWSEWTSWTPASFNCVPQPEPPPGACTDLDDDGCHDRSDPCWNSPLILNPGGAGSFLTSPADGVLFDIDADGSLEQTSWVVPGSGAGFLVLDRNGNGLIDDGSELFGNYTIGTHGVQGNGYQALALLDTNGNDTVDPADEWWSLLQIWQDENGNGVSEPDELSSLHEAGISALGYSHQWIGRRDRYGNLLKYRAFVQLSVGGRRPYYDVYLLEQ
jgi:hypothetical protein